MAANIIRQMDIKKTKEADLESGRPTWFLLGLVLVLAVMFVMLEYNGGTSADDDGADSLSALLPERDDGLVPMMLPHTVLRVAEPAEADADAARKTRIVDGSPADDLRRKLFDPEALVADHAMEPLDDVLRPGPRDSSSAPAELMDDKPLDFRVVESLPQFPGGAVAFMKWLTRNLRYPLAAERQKIEGRVVVQFIVERDGSVSGLKVTAPAHPYLNREAMRVLRTMPKWTPGVQNDRPCRTRVSIPVVFRL